MTTPYELARDRADRQIDISVEQEISQLARNVERKGNGATASAADSEPVHPALIACQKAAEMVRNVHERHTAEGETMAQHLEQIGKSFMEMCQDAANQIREQRILPKEMAAKIADELLGIGQQEAERQSAVAHGLRSARDALVGIEQHNKKG